MKHHGSSNDPVHLPVSRTKICRAHPCQTECKDGRAEAHLIKLWQRVLRRTTPYCQTFWKCWTSNTYLILTRKTASMIYTDTYVVLNKNQFVIMQIYGIILLMLIYSVSLQKFNYCWKQVFIVLVFDMISLNLVQF